MGNYQPTLAQRTFDWGWPVLLVVFVLTMGYINPWFLPFTP